MKRTTVILAAALLGLSMNAFAQASCEDVVHKHTMAPVSEMQSLGTDDQGFTTVVRKKNTRYALYDVELSKGEITTTTFQCDGKGKYRQYLTTTLPAGWSPWRDGSEWNADHWMTF